VTNKTVLVAPTFPHQQQEMLAGEGETEAAVGIQAYITEIPGFRGILKERYSDFVVRGTVVAKH
jgi:hypothetical protein